MKTYDYVVIGAGSAGCVIAHRLGADKRTRVLVIDAGSSDDSPLFRRPGMLALIYQVPQLKEKSDWGYKTAPQKHMDGREMPWTRSKITGGCTPGTAVVSFLVSSASVRHRSQSISRNASALVRTLTAYRER